MRSVTFADPDVVDLLNRSFVVLWDNHGDPERKGGKAVEQPSWSREELERYPEGGGGTNVISVVAGPDGRIVHHLQGWFRPARLVGELAFGLDLLDHADRAARQRERGAELRKEAATLEREHPDEMKKPFPESAIRRRHAALNLLAQAHDVAAALAGKDAAGYLDTIRQRGRVFK